MTKDKSVKEIGDLLACIEDPKDPLLAACRLDGRKGVLALAEKWQRTFEKREKSEGHWLMMTEFERELYRKGCSFVAGVDEVGRGPLAGPVVAAAVILPSDLKLPGLNDSKKISEAKRDAFYELIMEKAVAVGVGIMDCNVIDNINIYEATKKAMMEAISSLSNGPDALLIDAMTLPIDIPQQSLIKGDARSASIAAASIVAKVTRDRMMKDYDKMYPGYGFAKNMGYGTAEHLAGLKKSGPCPIHRRSFAPVKEAAEQ